MTHSQVCTSLSGYLWVCLHMNFISNYLAGFFLLLLLTALSDYLIQILQVYPQLTDLFILFINVPFPDQSLKGY